MTWLARALCALALLIPAVMAHAQEGIGTQPDIFAPGLVAPREDFGPDPTADDFAPIPYAPSEPIVPLAPDQPADTALTGAERTLTLEARLVDGGEPLADGMIWRIFGTKAGPDGALPLVATARGGSTSVLLPPGDYLVHAAFGRAAATKRVSLTAADGRESLVLNAGGLKLDAIVGEDQPVPRDRLTVEVMQENASGDLVTVVPKATPGLVLRLGAGTYHVISRYGTVNSVVRADIEVEAGKLTEAIMRHTGAEVTLKLVSTEGGEAIANTSWTVLTEAGDTADESVGAFPSIILAEGNYTAVAVHQNQIYSRDFTVESGVDRDVEVRLTDLVRPQMPLPPVARGGDSQVASQPSPAALTRLPADAGATMTPDESYPADVELDTDADMGAAPDVAHPD